MKRLSVKRWHEKAVLAAIILSCGFVLQADPPAREMKEKAGAWLSNVHRSGRAAVSKAHQAKYFSQADKTRYHEETR